MVTNGTNADQSKLPGEPEECTAEVQFLLTPDLMARLNAVAAARGLTCDALVAEALRFWLDAREKDNPVTDSST